MEPTSPTTEMVTSALRVLRKDSPTLGCTKVLATLKAENPTWTLSEQRLKKIMKDNNLGAGQTSSSVPLEPVASSSHIPENAQAAQLKFQESTLGYKLYGRGKWDYSVTFNPLMEMLLLIVQKRMTDFGWPTTEDSKLAIARQPLKTFWDHLWPAAQKAGISREDLGLQLEAEWGVNPEPYIYVPQTPYDKAQHDAQLATEAASFKTHYLDVMRSSLENGSSTPVDENGEPIWDDIKNSRYFCVVTKIDKITGEECGEL